MTLEVKVHFMKNLCLYNFIIHTKFDTIGFYTKKITNKYRFLNIKVTLCDLQRYWMIFKVILYFIKNVCRHNVDILEKLEKNGRYRRKRLF